MVRSDNISGALGRLKSRWLMAWAGSLQLGRRWIVSVGDLAFASRPLGSHLLLRSGTILVSATRVRRFSLGANDSLLHMELGATLYLLERHLNNIWSWRTLRKNCLAMRISLTDSFKQLHIQSLLWHLQAYALSSRWSRLASFLAIVVSHSRDLRIRCGCWVTTDVWVLTLLLRSAFWVHHYLSHQLRSYSSYLVLRFQWLKLLDQICLTHDSCRERRGSVLNLFRFTSADYVLSSSKGLLNIGIFVILNYSLASYLLVKHLTW